jgi:hypothetical protein
MDDLPCGASNEGEDGENSLVIVGTLSMQLLENVAGRRWLASAAWFSPLLALSSSAFPLNNGAETRACSGRPPDDLRAGCGIDRCGHVCFLAAIAAMARALSGSRRSLAAARVALERVSPR